MSNATPTVSRGLVRRVAVKYGIDPNVFERQINLESGFQKHVRSSAGAEGPAQLEPGTARELGVNINNPVQNLEGGARYLAQQLKAFGGDYRRALAAYNAGPGNIGAGLGYADKILNGQTPKSSGRSPSASAGLKGGSSRTIPGVDRSGERQTTLLNFLNNNGDILNTVLKLRQEQDTPSRTVTIPGQPTSGGGNVSGIVARANRINSARLPYQWGGGHAGKVNINHLTPLDCSGAVSAVLGIDPRVASQFEGWGKPGAGGKVTIYAKSDHVLMEINGHFFGTSQTNPGGGAGWIPRAALPASYLSQFVARHL